MERIVNKGKSVLLSKLADKVENTEPDNAVGSRSGSVTPISVTPNPMPLGQSQPSVINVVPVTVVNKPIEYENELVVEEDEGIFYTDSTTERIVLKSGVSNHPDIREWDLSECERLVELVVGDNCLAYLKEWKLIGLKSLERVEIGMGCMCKSEGGVFEVRGCAKLWSVKMGDGCCVKWSSFVMKNCESVEEVSIGDGCFVSCENIAFESESCLQQSDG